jgi:hypothetical protein
LCEGKFPASKSLNDPKGEEEERRLFYVAVTRARDGLYLCYPYFTIQRGTGIIQRPSRFLKELPEDSFERWDISEFANCSGYIPHTYSQCNHRIISLQMKCIEPLGESKSDYQIFSELAKRLGVYEMYTDGGKTELDWIKQYFHATDLPKGITWENSWRKATMSSLHQERN